MNDSDTSVQLKEEVEEGVEEEGEEQLNSVQIATQYSILHATTHRHSYSHICLGHCVHGGRDQRQLQLDVLGEIRTQLNGISREVNVAGKNDDVAANVGD